MPTLRVHRGVEEVWVYLGVFIIPIVVGVHIHGRRYGTHVLSGIHELDTLAFYVQWKRETRPPPPITQPTPEVVYL